MKKNRIYKVDIKGLSNLFLMIWKRWVEKNAQQQLFKVLILIFRLIQLAISFPFFLFHSRKVNEAKELEENSTILSAEFFSYKGEA